jgi:hypothetical protein
MNTKLKLHIYFLLLAATVVVVVVNLFFGWSIVFYLPFIVGGVGSFIFYIVQVSVLEKPTKQAKIICHAGCASVYIIGAFLLLVFYDTNFYASWSFHVWIISVLVVVAGSKKDFVVISLLLFCMFLSLFVLDLSGLLGRAVTAIGMGSFWGFSFYFLLVFLADIIENSRPLKQGD